MKKRYPVPPFNFETATQKVQMAEDAWNTKDPEKYYQDILSTQNGEIEIFL